MMISRVFHMMRKKQCVAAHCSLFHLASLHNRDNDSITTGKPAYRYIGGKQVAGSYRINPAITGIPEGDRKIINDFIIGREGLINLSSGNPAVEVPRFIRERVKEELDAGYMGYTNFWGIPELRKKLADKLKAECGIGADPDKEILFTHGVQEGLYIVMRTLLCPGDEVLIPTPHYGNFLFNTIACGAVPVFVPLREELGFLPDIRMLEEAITPRTKILIYSNPNNPLGVTWPEETIQELARLSCEYDLLVIADEIYRNFPFPGPPLSIASLPGMKDRSFTLQGFSKSYFMMGIRAGYVTGPAEIMSHVKHLHYVILLSPARLAQYAALASLDCPPGQVEPLWQEFRDRLSLLHEGVKEVQGMSCVHPNGTLFLFANIKSYGMPSLELSKKLILEAGVVTLPGTEFGSAGEGFLRLSVSSSREHIREGIERLKVFGKQYQKKRKEG